MSFLITPKINAASRMGEPILAFNLLKSKTEEEADAFARELMKINDKRKVEVAHIVKEIKKHIKERSQDYLVVAYGNPNWQPSLLGLAASKIAEEHLKPVFLWGRGDGTELKGSCRGYADISVFNLLNNLGEEFFTQYGGHQGAGGFVIRPEMVALLEERLSSHLVDVGEITKSHICDMQISADEITHDLIRSVEKLAPYGMANPKPLFVIEGVVHDVRNFGSAKNHFEVSFRKTNGDVIRAIAFYRTDESFRKIEPGETMKIVGHVEKNFFAGRHTLQIKLVDVL